MRLSSLLAVCGLVGLLGCTEGANDASSTGSVASELTSATCLIDNVVPTEYRRGDMEQFRWPTSIKRMQVLILSSDDKYFTLWGVAGNGSAVAFTVRALYSDQGPALADLNIALATHGAPGDGSSWGVQGTIATPKNPNPPVGPGGYPGVYVRRLLASAQQQQDSYDFLAGVAPGLQQLQ